MNYPEMQSDVDKYLGSLECWSCGTLHAVTPAVVRDYLVNLLGKEAFERCGNVREQLAHAEEELEKLKLENLEEEAAARGEYPP